ncbi:taurine ABC transporter permease [Methylocaldum marinum]|uniref:Taurine ABC transporter permease n=1 Tax=Methylocaldum marinum TaxID=1432792 RepID=A0A250KZI4_9GAMM|nr:ABC transporter permease [Methylocaldum marinum]BBA37040.1 taurine ABC transporter permease [Methylocaldum marinum]
MSALSTEILSLPKRWFVKRPTLSSIVAGYRGWLIPLALIGMWEIAAHFRWINPVLLSSPSLIFEGFARSFHEGLLVQNLKLSLIRMIGGWAVGSVIGLSVGLAIGLSGILDRVLGPTLQAFRQIAPFAWIPLISVWFGLGDSAKIAFIALVVFFPVVVNTYEGIRGVPKNLIEVSRVLMFSPYRLIRSVVLPSATPAILNGLELGFFYAWLATIGAEYLMNATGGLGSMMESAQESLEMDVVFVGVILSGLVGAGISLSLRLARGRLLRWRSSFV